MCELTEILLINFSGAGSLLSLAHFVEDIILGRVLNPNKLILEDTLSAVLYFLKKEEQNGKDVSILLVTLRQNHILTYLEKYVYEGFSCMGEKNPVYEDLLILLTNSES